MCVGELCEKVLSTIRGPEPVFVLGSRDPIPQLLGVRTLFASDTALSLFDTN